MFKKSEKILRDFVYIEDVLQATVKAGFSKETGVFNVGSGVARSFRDVADIVQNCLNSNYQYTYIDNPYTEGYQYFTQADISNTQSILGYKPKYSLEEGIACYMKLIKNNNK